MPKNHIFSILLLLYASLLIIDSEAQELHIPLMQGDVVNYKNSKSINYAIASAKEAKKAYKQCKAIFKGYYVNRYYRLSSRAHVDTTYNYLLKAIQFNKEAYRHNKDTLNLGADYLYRSEQSLIQAQTYLYGILNARKDKDIQYYGEVAMYYFGHAAVDAYRASMYLIDGTKIFDEIPSDNYLREQKPRYQTKPLLGDRISTDDEIIDAQSNSKNGSNNSSQNSSETISIDQLEKLLNASEDKANKFLESIDDNSKLSDEDQSRNINRLESDEAAFSVLKYSYEQKIEEKSILVDNLKLRLKNAKNGKERKKIAKELEKEEAILADLKEKHFNASNQLTQIQKELGKRKMSFNDKRAFPTEEEVSSRTDYPLNPKLPRGLIYKIQIGYYPWKMTPLFKGKKVEQESLVIAQLDGWNLRYLTSEFSTYNYAAIRRNEIQANYVSDAFIVAFYNGRKINMYEALKIENED